MSLSILVVGLHVYLIQKLVKILEEEGHYVIAVFSSEMISKNLADRDFDIVLVNHDVSPSLRRKISEAIDRNKQDTRVIEAIYDRQGLLDSLPSEN